MWKKEQAILQHHELAIAIGQSMWFRSYRLRKAMPVEDCVGEAALALVYAAEKFDPGREKSFAAFAQRVIRNHLRRLYASADYISHESCLTDVETSSDEKVSFFEELCVSEDAMLDVVETLEAISHYLQQCNEKERTVFSLLLEGYSQKECGAELVKRKIMRTCTQPEISRVVKRMCNELHFAFSQ